MNPKVFRQAAVDRQKNGRVRLEFGNLSWFGWWRIQHQMRQRGFSREGPRIDGGPDERIFPSFRRDGILIEAGWDKWLGYYLAADTVEAADYLVSVGP